MVCHKLGAAIIPEQLWPQMALASVTSVNGIIFCNNWIMLNAGLCYGIMHHSTFNYYKKWCNLLLRIRFKKLETCVWTLVSSPSLMVCHKLTAVFTPEQWWPQMALASVKPVNSIACCSNWSLILAYFMGSCTKAHSIIIKSDTLYCWA